MKVGDKITARVDNKTPDGLLIAGEITATDSAAGMVEVATQFGVRMWLKEADATAQAEG